MSEDSWRPGSDIVFLPDQTGVVAAPPAEDGVEAVRVLTVPGAARPGELAGERLQDVDQLPGGTLVEHLALLHLQQVSSGQQQYREET